MSFKVNRSFHQRMKELAEPQDVPLVELFNEAFMAEHTQFTTFPEMYAAANMPEGDGVTVDAMREAFESPEWNEFVAAHSRFPSWDEMKVAAARANVQKRFREKLR